MKKIRKAVLRALIWTVGAFLSAAIVFTAASEAWMWRDGSRARMTTEGPFTATEKSLDRHGLPSWFADAKFGIMLRWGLYSVPAFAPAGRTFAERMAGDYDRAMTRNPYAEDYANAMKDPSSPTAEYHRRHYGTAPYSGFAPEFEAGLEKWDPEGWAAAFHAAGASYVVITAKYADGYALWPTSVRNPHAPGFHSERDLVGELAKAVRAKGMRFGVYYSGGADWTFRPGVVRTFGDHAYQPYGEDYRAYAVAQMRELIERYEPDILWNDVFWPTGHKRLFSLLADYYNTVPEGVVNDRWETVTLGRQILGWEPVRGVFDAFLKRALPDPEAVDGLGTRKDVPHSDFRTFEHGSHDTVQEKFWQRDRGIGGSFGWNRAETDADYASFEEILNDLVNAAANNGALMLNIGPGGGEGVIPPGQRDRLKAIGAWMRVNREALDGTRPWRRSVTATRDGAKVAFTRKGDVLYATVLGRPEGSVVLEDVVLRGTATHLGTGERAALSASEGGTRIAAEALDGSYAPVFRMTP
ncbi:alpha-L-fucosidase [Actinocorallia populi]|uniref:alpha-L-fucosidase n=1 Tax=Actinocorallia populi TaxID=2079200 RepID=UPI0013004551|nr:alpha-L-fucosidase [Actinocorallia populi]